MDANSLLIVLFREVRVKHRALGEALNVHSANQRNSVVFWAR